MPTPKVQNAGDFGGARTVIVSTVKVSYLLCCLQYYNTIMQEISVKCGLLNLP